MTALSRIILKRFPVRKTHKQKKRFMRFMQKHIPEAEIEKSWKGSNLVVGNVSSAKILLTAHYDTCSQMLFPNFITPYNGFFYSLYQILLIIPFFLIAVISDAILQRTGVPFLQNYSVAIAYTITVAVIYIAFLGPVPNKHTVNDNTSGVITLCEIYAALTPEQKKQVCFVFFDNEENGLLGSSAFAYKHKEDGIREKLVLNFDCVSEGDHIMLTMKKTVLDKYGDQLNAAFCPTSSKTVDITSKAFYPSDQASFKQGVAVAALRKHKTFGLMLDKIHTKRDTVLQEENIAFLTDCTVRLIRTMEKD